MTICKRRLRNTAKARIAAAFLAAVVAAAVVGAAGYYRQTDPRLYVLKRIYEIGNLSDLILRDIRVTIQIGVKSDSLYQNNLDFSVEPALTGAEADPAGNVYGWVDIDRLPPGRRVTITIISTFENSGVDFGEEIYRLDNGYDAFMANGNNRQYLRPRDMVECDAEPILSRAAEFDRNQPPAALAGEIYDFVNMHLTYDINPAYANRGALSALNTGRGVCMEYASLFVALCRAVGIPARVVVGYWIKQEPALAAWTSIGDTAHAWAEFFLDGVGWVPAEPTFIYSVNGRRKPNRDYFARLVPTDRHFVTGYEMVQDIKVTYSCFSDGDKARTSADRMLDLVLVEESVMPTSSNDT